MLKNIPSILSPEMLKVLMEMGHGDEIVIADGNFPGASHANILLRADGHNVPELLDAILKLMPLDTYADPAFVMQVTPGDKVETPIWDVYRKIIAENADDGDIPELKEIERFAFYERTKKAYAVIMTGETALYANILLKKGVVKA